MFNSNMTNVLLKLSEDGDYIAISTYCRRHGRRGRFLIHKEQMQQVLEARPSTLYDSDCGNHVTIRNYNDTLHITFDWLSEYSDGTLKGFRQKLEVPVVVFTELMKAGEPMRYLYRVRHAQARIKAIPAAKVIREVQKSRIIRSAFRKALRDSFHWKGDTVTLYRDGGMDFFFRTASGCPAEGGLILHRTTVRTPVGMRPKVYYGVHT